MNLVPSQLRYTYEVNGESGYNFTVYASKDDEAGWSASVQVSTWGFKTPEAAVEQLAPALRVLLSKIEEE